MPLIDRVLRSVRRREPPREIERAAPVSMEEFGRILGQTTGTAVATRAGVTVTEQTSLEVTAWWSGVRYISETVAGLPAPVFRRLADGNRSARALPGWRRNPHPSTTWQSIVEVIVLSLIHRGNAFVWKDRNELGQVVGLTPLHPSRVRFGLDRDEAKWFQVTTATGERIPATSREILHIPGLTWDGFFGVDAIRYFAAELGTTRAADEYAAAFYSGADHLRGYISMPQALAEDEIKRLKIQWERFHRGLANAHEFGVLGNGATYDTIGLDAEQTQLLETRQFGVSGVARMLRLPPHKLYDLSRATFSNIEQQAIEATTDGIRPWTQRIEWAVNADPDLMRPRNFLEFNLEGLLRGDTEARFTAYDTAIKGGWMAPAEVRRLENQPPVEGLDYYQRPLNVDTIGPDADAADQTEADEFQRNLDLARALQTLYLAVGPVISQDEAREIINRLGGDLSGPGPDFPPPGRGTINP